MTRSDAARGRAARRGRDARRVRRVRRRGRARGDGGRAARGRAARADGPAAQPRPAQDGGAGRRQRPHPHRGHAQPGRPPRSPPARGGWSRRASRSHTRPAGTGLKTEDDPLWDDAPWPWSRSMRRCTSWRTPSRDGRDRGHRAALRVLLRAGLGYADDGHFAREVTKRRLPIVGKGSGVFSFIHVDDAAAATVAAMERGGARHLQRRGRRTGADARLGAGLRRGRGREAAAPRAGLARAPGRRALRRGMANAAARRLEREGAARARLAAAATRAGARAFARQPRSGMRERVDLARPPAPMRRSRGRGSSAATSRWTSSHSAPRRSEPDNRRPRHVVAPRPRRPAEAPRRTSRARHPGRVGTPHDGDRGPWCDGGRDQAGDRDPPAPWRRRRRTGSPVRVPRASRCGRGRPSGLECERQTVQRTSGNRAS